MGTWNLDILYKGFDTDEYKADMKTMEELIPECEKLAANADNMAPVELLTEFVKLSEKLNSLINKLSIYVVFLINISVGNV